MKGYTVLRWCRTVAALAACLAITASPAPTRAEEMLYPHAERVGGPWGYIDRTGKIVVPLQFDWAEPFSEGLAAVSVNKKLGYIDNAGRFIITPQYTGSLFTDASFRNGHAVVMDGKEARLIDRHDNIITVDRPGARIVPRMDPTLQQVEPGYRKPTDDDRIIIKSEKLGAIDLSGRTIIEPEYDRMEPFSEGLAAVYRGGKVGFVDRDGKLVIPIGIEGYSLRFLDGRAKVTKTQPWHHCGFIDRTGKLIIPDITTIARTSTKVVPPFWSSLKAGESWIWRGGLSSRPNSPASTRRPSPFARGSHSGAEGSPRTGGEASRKG